jgi:hypothetical protein
MRLAARDRHLRSEGAGFSTYPHRATCLKLDGKDIITFGECLPRMPGAIDTPPPRLRASPDKEDRSASRVGLLISSRNPPRTARFSTTGAFRPRRSDLIGVVREGATPIFLLRSIWHGACYRWTPEQPNPGLAKSSRKRQASVLNTNGIEMTDNHHG